MKALRPGSIKIVDPSRDRCERCLSYLDPNGLLVLRDHPLSEQKSDMARDPVGTGKRHADDWIAKLTTGKLAGLPKDKLLVCGINEPHVHNAESEAIVVAYSRALIERCASASVRVLVGNLSVGWPRNTDTATQKNTPPVWDSFLPLEQPMIDSGSVWGQHEYWFSDPDDSWYTAQNGEKWGWYSHRINTFPMAVPVIIGECGYNLKVKEDQWVAMGRPSEGWLGRISAGTYAEQLWRYADKLHPNVHSIQPFTTDSNNDWWFFDTPGAHAEILARKHAHTWTNEWPVKTTGVTTSDKNLLIVPKYVGCASGYYGSLYNGSSGPYAHEGVDLPMKVGTPIVAGYDGVVAWSDEEPTTYGQYIRVYHPEIGICLFYGHLSERRVQTGNSVKQGQLIGLSGNTGNSTGPHLHMEVRLMTASGSYQTGISCKGNGRVDPIAWLAGWMAHGGKVQQV